MWKELNEEQKIKYKEYCDFKYGKTIVFSESGEPMYLDKQGFMIDTAIVLNLLFSIYTN